MGAIFPYSHDTIGVYGLVWDLSDVSRGCYGVLLLNQDVELESSSLIVKLPEHDDFDWPPVVIQ